MASSKGAPTRLRDAAARRSDLGMVAKATKPGQGSAVLCSAGLDSAVLVAAESAAGTRRVQPVYVSVGLAWETAELAMLERLLAAPCYAGVNAAARLTCDMRDVYASSHWAVRGEPPAYDTPDSDVYLAGRNGLIQVPTGSGKTFAAVMGPIARMLASRLAWVSITPFGNPVVPAVNISTVTSSSPASGKRNSSSDAALVMLS